MVFTAGTANIRAAAIFRTAQSTCAALGLRGVFVTRDASVVPPTIGHETFVPFARLLPRSRALVSHGGIGSTAQVLAARHPPPRGLLGFDQRDNGSRLAGLGAGGLLPLRRFRGKRALQAVESALSSDTATRSRELSDLVDRDAALEATMKAPAGIAEPRLARCTPSEEAQAVPSRVPDRHGSHRAAGWPVP